MLVEPQTAIQLLKNHDIVALPTETVYGLAGRADSQQAISKIYAAKNRPPDNPLICHFDSINMIQKWGIEIDKISEILLQELTPGPLSILLKLPKNSPLKVATSGLDSIICRIPNHPITLNIINQLDIPLAAPSANSSSKFSGTNPEMIEQDLGQYISGIVDGGTSQIGLESSILKIDIEGEQIKILRPGAIGKNEVKKVLNKYDLNHFSILENTQNPDPTPGSKYKHYSPKTPLKEVSRITLEKASATLCLHKDIPDTARQLSTNIYKLEGHYFIDLGQNITQASHYFYYSLYLLDGLKVDQGNFFLKLGLDSLSLALKDKLERILENYN